MRKEYKIIKTFLGDLHYYFPNPLESLFVNNGRNIEQNTDIDVKVWSANEENHYVVDVHVEITEGFGGQTDFLMNLVYSVLVKVSKNCETEEDELIEMLGQKIPPKVFPVIRDLVKVLSLSSGFPSVELDDVDFEALWAKHITKDDPEPVLGYDWILWDIRSSKEGASFLETITDVYADKLLVYKELPMYKYFYRFLHPIPYSHPFFEECEPDYWEILFQLVFAESEDVRLINVEGGAPEIEFSFQQFRSINLSNISLKEIKEITSALACQAFTGTMVSLFRMPIDENYAESLPDGKPPLEEQLRKVYTTNPDMNDEDYEFIDRVCYRIRNYDDLTFDYRLLQE